MLPKLGLRFDAEAGAIRQLEPPIGAAHSGIDKAQIGVEYRMLMLVKRNIGHACGAKQACRMKNTDAYRRMRNDADRLRVGELADTELDNFAQDAIDAITAFVRGFSLSEGSDPRPLFLRFESTRGIRRCVSGLDEPGSYNT